MIDFYMIYKTERDENKSICNVYWKKYINIGYTYHESILFTNFKSTISIILSKFMELYNHHYNLILQYFHHPKGFPYTHL